MTQVLSLKVYDEVTDWIKSRGIPQSKPKHFEVIEDLTTNIVGKLAQIALRADRGEDQIRKFIGLAQNHKIRSINTSGRMFEFKQLIDESLRGDFFYEKFERQMLSLRLGGVQSGDGEIALVLLDRDGILYTDNQDADVFVGNVNTQVKKIGTNHTNPARMEAYYNSPSVDYIMMIDPEFKSQKKVDNRVWVCDTSTTHWSDVFYHNEIGQNLRPVHPY